VDKILHQLGSSIDSFDATICEDDGLPIKPSPVPFQEIARRLNVSISNVWFVGDSVSKDIIPAKRVGMRTILIEPPVNDGDPNEADHRVRTATDVAEIITND
jgi:FMN phosphatase YigB (HAD superfamily)